MDMELKIIDKDLALQQAGGNADLAQELFEMLLKELPEHGEKLRAALNSGDIPQLIDYVHKLNGSATYCGVPALKAAADSLETELKRGHTDVANSGVAQILEEIDRILEVAA